MSDPVSTTGVNAVGIFDADGHVLENPLDIIKFLPEGFADTTS